MSYKYSKGAQVVGDLKAADDTQRDTLIDFGEDRIDFQTSGSTRMTVSNSGVQVTGLQVGDAFSLPTADGSANQYIKTDGNGNLSWATLSGGGGGEGGLSNIVEDTTPQLGGDLDINGNKITSTSNGDIVIEPHGTGKVKFPTMSDFTGFPILLFTGSSGELTSSNSIKFNPTRDAIGVGITTGGSTTAGLYSSTQTTPQYKIHAIGDINDGATFCTETYADSTGASRFRFMKARGTPDSPAAINANDEIGRIEWLAYTGSSNGMEAKRSGYIIMTAEADADGKMVLGTTYNGVESNAFEIYNNKLTAYKQLFSYGGLYPYVNKGASLGGASYQWDQVNAATVKAFEDLYIGATNRIYDQSGLGISINDDYEPHSTESDMEGLILNSKYTSTANVIMALVKTGSHTVGVGTYGTGNSNENVVSFGQYSSTSFEFRNNVGVKPLNLQGGNLLMKLNSNGNLMISGSLELRGESRITPETFSTDSQRQRSFTFRKHVPMEQVTPNTWHDVATWRPYVAGGSSDPTASSFWGAVSFRVNISGHTSAAGNGHKNIRGVVFYEGSSADSDSLTTDTHGSAPSFRVNKSGWVSTLQINADQAGASAFAGMVYVEVCFSRGAGSNGDQIYWDVS